MSVSLGVKDGLASLPPYLNPTCEKIESAYNERLFTRS